MSEIRILFQNMLILVNFFIPINESNQKFLIFKTLFISKKKII